MKTATSPLSVPHDRRCRGDGFAEGADTGRADHHFGAVVAVENLPQRDPRIRAQVGRTIPRQPCGLGPVGNHHDNPAISKSPGQTPSHRGQPLVMFIFPQTGRAEDTDDQRLRAMGKLGGQRRPVNIPRLGQE